MSLAPEFSRLVPLARLAAGGCRQRIAAEPEERRRLAARFGLEALDCLTAVVELRRSAGGVVLLDAEFEARFVQSCVVTLEPVAGTLGARFRLRYGPPEAEAAQADIEGDVDGPAFEPLVGEAIDIGEAVAQELSLQLPPFPRLPDAIVDAGPGAEPPPTAFDGLAGRGGGEED
jgi:uncharacterized metal-binding protein YceD (DUF177 family)